MGKHKNPTKDDVKYTQNFLKEFNEKLKDEKGFTDNHRAELNGRAKAVKEGDRKACQKLTDLWEKYLKENMEQPTEPEPTSEPESEPKTEYVYRIPTINNAPVVNGKAWVRDLNKVGYTDYTGHEGWIVVHAKGKFPSCETEEAKKKGVQCAETVAAS